MFDSGRGSLLGGGGPVSVVLPGPKLALNGPAIHCRIIALLLLIHYFTMWPWPLTPWPWSLTFDLEHWAYRLWRDETLYQSNNPRRSYCDFSVWSYDLEHCLKYCARSGIIFTNFDLWQLIRTWIIAFLCWYAVTLTFDPLTLKSRGTSSVTWSKSAQNLSEIEQSTAELLTI